jgi:2',3'-cyclic-nucleotide 2'-phosphodiesterase (5'-nucleotidase family)
MTRRSWLTRAFLIAALVLPAVLAAQDVSSERFRPAKPVPIDAITILQTTDIHDHANGTGHEGLDVEAVSGMSNLGAYARISSYVNYVRTTAGHPVLLIDSGDWTMGTLYDLTLGSRPLALFYLNSMRYDCVTLGNHEFDYTPRGLAQMIGLAQTSFGFQTPIVASNMSLGGNADLAPFFGTGKVIQPTFLEQLPNGMKIGFIGLMGEAAAVDAPASAPVTFAPLSSSYAQIQSMVDDLRNSGGAQIVIALSHSGTDATGTSGEDVELARHVHGINVIASGHTHTPLNSAHAVANGSWTTQIIDAGAFGANVARLDLAVQRSSGVTTPLAFQNMLMADGSLNLVRAGLGPDPSMIGLINATDRQLNSNLAPLLSQSFPDYSPTNIGKGIYHPVGVSAQNLNSNAQNPVVSPNGLGDLAADSIRNVPNAIVAQTFTAVGGNPANLPGYDFTPYQVGVVATGVLRAGLQGGVPLTFSDLYNVLPLGISPDTTQALPVGYPLISTYVDPGDVKKVCALQLVAQSNLVPSDFYLNLSGIRYGLKPTESYVYFKYATAAAILDLTSRKISTGSAPALQVLLAIGNMGNDHGAALVAAGKGGNPYAAALVNLNDTNPDAGQTTANLAAVAEVATASFYGTRAVSALVVSKAVAAIDTVSGFAASDGTNTGATTDLSSTARIRVSVDLYALLLLNAVESQYGIKITPYQAATGTTALSSADYPTLLANRIDAAPATPGVQELKEWMALLSNVGSGLGGSIGINYYSSPDFTQFPTLGSAVRTRNASYPLASIGQLVGTVAALQQAP